MSLNEKYDPDNIFAKILRGEIGCVKLYETENVLAFMDVFPQSKGHCLVIHKKATATNLFDIDKASLSDVINTVQKVAAAVIAGLKPDGVRIAQFNGAPAGQTVYHTHFHIIPVYEGEALGRHAAGGPADAEVETTDRSPSKDTNDDQHAHGRLDSIVILGHVGMGPGRFRFLMGKSRCEAPTSQRGVSLNYRSSFLFGAYPSSIITLRLSFPPSTHRGLRQPPRQNGPATNRH